VRSRLARHRITAGYGRIPTVTMHIVCNSPIKNALQRQCVYRKHVFALGSGGTNHRPLMHEVDDVIMLMRCSPIGVDYVQTSCDNADGDICIFMYRPLPTIIVSSLGAKFYCSVWLTKTISLSPRACFRLFTTASDCVERKCCLQQPVRVLVYVELYGPEVTRQRHLLRLL